MMGNPGNDRLLSYNEIAGMTFGSATSAASRLRRGITTRCPICLEFTKRESGFCKAHESAGHYANEKVGGLNGTIRMEFLR